MTLLYKIIYTLIYYFPGISSNLLQQLIWFDNKLNNREITTFSIVNDNLYSYDVENAMINGANNNVLHYTNLWALSYKCGGWVANTHYKETYLLSKKHINLQYRTIIKYLIKNPDKIDILVNVYKDTGMDKRKIVEELLNEIRISIKSKK